MMVKQSCTLLVITILLFSLMASSSSAKPALNSKHEKLNELYRAYMESLYEETVQDSSYMTPKKDPI
jgi:hypothetical protein